MYEIELSLALYAGKVDQNFEAGAHGECADAGSLQQNPCTVLGKVETAVTATCWERFKPHRYSLRTCGSGMGAPSVGCLVPPTRARRAY